MIVGIDAGNYNTKVMGAIGLDIFPSQIGEFSERNLVSNHGKDDMIFEYKGRKGFAGTLAIESDFSGSIMGDTKAHEDALIRVLLALYRYSNSTTFEIIVGQPISKHNLNEKQKIKEMLLGGHSITVNGNKKTIHIRKCEVAAEGGSAFWSNPHTGLVRIIDVGSATINFASIVDKKYLNKDSWTFAKGLETLNTRNLEVVANGIFKETSRRWDKDDKVLLTGGGAESLLEPMNKYFTNIALLKPLVVEASDLKMVSPIYANSIGFYNIGVNIYG